MRFGCVAFVLFIVTAINAETMDRQVLVNKWIESMMKRTETNATRSLLRNASVQKLRLDSMTFKEGSNEAGMVVQFNKMIFHYNQYGLMTSNDHFWAEDSIGNPVPYERSVYVYDSFGNMTADSTFERSEDDTQLFLRNVVQYRFSSMGVLLMKRSKSRKNEFASWTGDSGEEYEFNEHGKLSRQVSSILSGNDNWTVARKKDFNYDASDYLQSEIQYYWDQNSNDWIGLDKRDYFYDTLHKDTMDLSYNYYPLQTRWALASRGLNRYDAGGRLLERLNTNWNESTSEWYDNGKDVYAYDAQGYRILAARFGMNTGTNTWEPISREEWSYDLFGNMLSNTTFSNVQDDQSWWMKTITDYQHNLDVRTEDMVWPFLPEDLPTFNQITGMRLTWAFPALDTSVVLAFVTFHYSPMEVMGATSMKTDVPDWLYEPATKTLLFKTGMNQAKVQVFDLQGRSLLSRSVNDRLSLSGLKKGMYVIRVTSKKGLEQRKLMME